MTFAGLDATVRSMNAMLDLVIGDICPYCDEELYIEGEFGEGSEIECPACGKQSFINTVQATYTITMEKMETEEECEVEDEDQA